MVSIIHCRCDLIVPRALRAPDAARYIGVSKTKFLELVSDGRMPQAVRIDGCTLWDRLALDVAFDGIAADDNCNPWDA